MRTVQTLSEEQKERIKQYFTIYHPEAVDMFNGLLAKEKEIIKELDFYKSYENIIKKTAKLLKEIGTSEPLIASAAFQYLLWNGYISKDKELVYSRSNRKNNLVIPGADIVCGKSVCLNNADMEASVLRTMGYESYIMGCLINTSEKINLEYRPNIERKIDTHVSLCDKIINKLMPKIITRKAGNHAVTLIKTNDCYVISDPTNLAYANINDLMTAKFVGSKTETTLKAYLMLIINGMKYEDFESFIARSFLHSDEEVLNVNLVKKIFETAIYLCERNNSLLDDYHDDIYHDINCVSNNLTSKIKRKTK